MPIGDSTQGRRSPITIVVIGYPGVADMKDLLDEKSQLQAVGHRRCDLRRSSTRRAASRSCRSARRSRTATPAAPRSTSKGNVVGLATFGNEGEVQGFNFLVASATLRTSSRTRRSSQAERHEEGVAGRPGALLGRRVHRRDREVRGGRDAVRRSTPRRTASCSRRTCEEGRQGEEEGEQHRRSSSAARRRWRRIPRAGCIWIVHARAQHSSKPMAVPSRLGIRLRPGRCTAVAPRPAARATAWRRRSRSAPGPRHRTRWSRRLARGAAAS